MSENICKVCNEKFEDKYFDKEQNKCILHCEKASWHKEEETILGKIYKCDDIKYKLFREYFINHFNIIKTTSLRIENIHFPYNPIDTPDSLSSIIMNNKIEEIYIGECRFYGSQNILLNQHELYQLKRMKFFNVFSDYDLSLCSCKVKNLDIVNCNISNLTITFSEFENINLIGHFLLLIIEQ